MRTPGALERQLWRQGLATIAGVDEAGRGPLAGPVVAAAVLITEGLAWPGLDDSKQLSPDRREELYARIVEEAPGVGVAAVEPPDIDAMNILRATLLAMARAIVRLPEVPGHILVDGNQRIPAVTVPQTAIVGGDAACTSIAAASVVAKVTRDRLMCELDGQYPVYGFSRHKGYATKEHLRALSRHGPCSAHRMSFAPVKRASQELRIWPL
jgi:ribonuclease HII